MQGENKKSSPPDTAEDGWRAKLSKWHGQTEQPRQIKRGGSKKQNKQAKPKQRGKNTVQCSTSLGFFMGFVVGGVCFP